MRALRVVGLDEDGESVVCEDPENGERFTVPADERLRAAARGDMTRLGQAQIELEAKMRPREIQARIRAGASVEEVAEAAGVPEQRVERYAYPVLLERARVAEMAQKAHPVRDDGPDVQTLGEVVAHTFGVRGHDYAQAAWDAWRGEDGKWVVQLLWQAGRSENRAHWIFHQGANGGTVTALDEHAADLIDPSPNRPLRTVRPVTELAREALQLEGAPQHDVAAGRAEAPVEQPGEPAVPEQASDSDELAVPEPMAEPEPAASAEQDEEGRKAGQRRGRKSHPIVPSWEDVLLGVRSHR